MATVEETIGTTGGRDFTSPQAWEAAIPTDTTDDYVGTCMVDELYAVGQLAINVSNANGVSIKLTVDSTVRHAFVFEGARIQYGIANQSPALATIYITTDGVTIEALAIRGNNTNPATATGEIQGGTTLFKNCYMEVGDGTLGRSFYATNWSTASGSPQNVNFESCAMVEGVAVLVTSIGATSYGNMNVHNCSIYGTYNQGIFTNNGATNRPTIEIKNTKVLGVMSFESFKFHTGGAASASSDYNVAEDTTAPGANSIQSESAADHYTSVTSGSEDLSIDASLDKSSFIGDNTLAGEVDVEGDTFVTDYCDMGCDAESVAPAAGGSCGPQGGFFSSFGSFGRMG